MFAILVFFSLHVNNLNISITVNYVNILYIKCNYLQINTGQEGLNPYLGTAVL